MKSQEEEAHDKKEAVIENKPIEMIQPKADSEQYQQIIDVEMKKVAKVKVDQEEEKCSQESILMDINPTSAFGRGTHQTG